MAQTASNSNIALLPVKSNIIEPIKIGEIEFSHSILLKMREVLEERELSPEKIWVLPNKIRINSAKFKRLRKSIYSSPPILKNFPLEKAFLLHRTSSGEILPSPVVKGKYYRVSMQPLLTQVMNRLIRIIAKSRGFKDIEEQGYDVVDIMAVLMAEENSEVVQEVIRCLGLNDADYNDLDFLRGFIGGYHLHNDIDLPVPNHYDLQMALENPIVKVVAVGGYLMETPIVTIAVRNEKVYSKEWFTMADELYIWLHWNADHEYRYIINLDAEYRREMNYGDGGYPMLLIPRQDWNYLQSLEIVRKLILSKYFTIASINLDEFTVMPTIPSVVPSDVYYILKRMMTAFLRYVPKNKQRKVRILLETCHPRRVRRLIAFFQNTFLGLLEIGMKGGC